MSKSLYKLINKIQDDELKKEFQDWYDSNIVEIKAEHLVSDLELAQSQFKNQPIKIAEETLFRMIGNSDLLKNNILLNYEKDILNIKITAKLAVIKCEL